MTEQDGVGRSSATEILRRMLDERGVEWMDDSYANLWCTVWHGRDGKQWRMTENRSGMLTELRVWHVTPEQAIAATLGAGTCLSDPPTRADLVHVVRCRDCKHGFDEGSGYLYCGRRPGHCFETRADGFCAWGERKEVDA